MGIDIGGEYWRSDLEVVLNIIDKLHLITRKVLVWLLFQSHNLNLILMHLPNRVNVSLSLYLVVSYLKKWSLARLVS